MGRPPSLAAPRRKRPPEDARAPRPRRSRSQLQCRPSDDFAAHPVRGQGTMKNRFRIIVLAAVFWCPTSASFAQDAVPTEILTRTLFIKIGNEAGTAFTIDHKGKLYLVTARHIVVGVPESNAIIQVHQAGIWKDYHTVKTLYPSSRDVDIAVFDTNETAPQQFGVEPMGKADGIAMGQQVWFIGYPFGLGSPVGEKSESGLLPPGTVLPFMKRGTMSAIDGTNPDAVVLYIDGFNNPGFSGGPIVFWSFKSHTYKILGVVKGYREDTAKVIVNGQHVDTQLLVNSGILVGYSIRHAVDTIEQSQDGAAGRRP